MSELTWLPATEIAAGVAARRFSPVEVVAAALARLETVESKINAFAERMDEAARAAAKQAEAVVMAGGTLGPLHGVPLTVKDNVAMAGRRLGNGSAACRDLVATQDAIIIGRLKAAGAIIIGRTTLPEFAHRILTDSPTWGVTRNPWNLAHTPGGSSGGGSAALAAGVAPLAVGTDGGGSIRCPASCVGAVGLKASLGTIPNESFGDAFGNYSFVGPLARHAADAALMFAAMAGGAPGADPHGHARGAQSAAVAPEGAARGLRIGWVEHFGPYRTTPEVARLCTEAVSALAAEGAIVEPVAPPCFETVYETYHVIATAAHGARLAAHVEKWGEAITPSMRESIAIGRRWSAAELVAAQDRRSALYRAVQALFERFDVLAMPTMTAPPATVDANGSVASAWYAEVAAPLYPFNLTGNPAISVPAGFAAGELPVGLQLVGPWLAEKRLLDLAALLEARQDFVGKRPAI